MSDALRLDPAKARTVDEQRVIEMRNEDSSWRVIADQLGLTKSQVRRIWNQANHHQRAELPEPDVKPFLAREDPTIGNEQAIRGWPATGFGGAIPGTRPGDSAWRAEQDAAITTKRRKVS